MEQIMERLYAKQINPLEAVRLVSEEIGGLVGVTLKEGLTIQNPQRRISIKMNGRNANEIRMLREFATLAYWMAGENGSMKPGEVHLERGLSSKHYARGFRDYVAQLLAKYSRN